MPEFRRRRERERSSPAAIGGSAAIAWTTLLQGHAVRGGDCGDQGGNDTGTLDRRGGQGWRTYCGEGV